MSGATGAPAIARRPAGRCIIVVVSATLRQRRIITTKKLLTRHRRNAAPLSAVLRGAPCIEGFLRRTAACQIVISRKDAMPTRDVTARVAQPPLQEYSQAARLMGARESPP